MGTCAPICGDNNAHLFDHPFAQAFAMFVGEFLCLVVYKLLFYTNKVRPQNVLRYPFPVQLCSKPTSCCKDHPQTPAGCGCGAFDCSRAALRAAAKLLTYPGFLAARHMLCSCC